MWSCIFGKSMKTMYTGRPYLISCVPTNIEAAIVHVHHLIRVYIHMLTCNHFLIKKKKEKHANMFILFLIFFFQYQ